MNDTRDTILIADDQPINRAILREIFGPTYACLEAENGEQALVLLRKYHRNLAILLLDVIMPVQNGYQVLRAMDQEGYLDEVPVIVITALDSDDDEIKVFDMGAADIIVKPFEPYMVKRRVQNMIELFRQKLYQNAIIQEQEARLRESNDLLVDSLASVIETRSLQTGQHIRRMRMLTRALLECTARNYPEYGLTKHKIDMIVSASAMHDVGKIAIPDSILNKTGRLTDLEYEIMKTHSRKGSDMMAQLDSLSHQEYLHYAYDICRYHHERWDSAGYPDGIRGAEIPVWAQIVGIADCYDALTHDRVYKKGILPDKAINMILNGDCGLFSPKLLECLKQESSEFLHILCLYPDAVPVSGTTSGAPDGKACVQPISEEALEADLGQMKYLSVLQYIEATVMEIDFDNKVYHLVYMVNRDFEELRSKAGLLEALSQFMENAVYPDDRLEVLPDLEAYLTQFFEEKVLRRSRTYRVRSIQSGKYYPCEATLIRIKAGAGRRRALCIWRRLGAPDGAVNRTDTLARQWMLYQMVEGIQCCRADGSFTMSELSDGLLRMLGYTAAEAAEKFENSYLKVIYGPDRAMVLCQYKEQRERGCRIELMYRIETKSGDLRWFLDKSYLVTREDGEEYIYFILIDITQTKRAEEELRQLMERYQIIIEQTNDIIFEWDVPSDQIRYSAKYGKRASLEPSLDQDRQPMMQALHVHPEDLPEFSRLVTEIRKGLTYCEMELRLENEAAEYHWYKLRIAAQPDHAGTPGKAVGVMTCIDQEKESVQRLHEKADHDSLTKLYNRAFAVQAMQNHFKEHPGSGISALFILDVDNFKQINDTYGHLFGDEVLKRVSAELRALFRNDDIIARLGGDEFLVFMKNIKERDIADMRAAKVNRVFRSVRIAEEAQFRMTCSIGVAIFPDDGAEFSKLFQHCDLALYAAKANGKNQYMLYDAQTMKDSFKNLQALAAMRTSINSD